MELLDTKSARVGYILQTFPDARNNDNLLCKLYWELFDGATDLNDIIYATKAEVIRRARQLWNAKGMYMPTDQRIINRRLRVKRSQKTT
ncbi:hypothetical protein [Alicyclobacillus shizuokensis]|uniref:hypothetical protein n=1 Tax=Alicyclobacillus shizuokensis TaxID=392014 RepID=UPI00082F2F28|nr:hypothetical protein [Alicyclobacillus shizuokensis]